MIAKTENRISFIEGLEEFHSRLQNDSPLWLSQLRTNGLLRFKELGIPTTKEEEWKYTNIKPITEHHFQISTVPEIHEREAFNQYCSPKEINIVFVNGIFTPALSNLKNLPKGVLIANLQEAIRNNDKDVAAFFKKNEGKDSDSFVLLNNALFQNGAFVRLDPKVILEPLIHIVHVTSSSDPSTPPPPRFLNTAGQEAGSLRVEPQQKDISGAQVISCPRSIILLGKSAEAQILESHVCFSPTVYFTNALTDGVLAEDSKLLYCRAQGESPRAFHIETTRVWQERNSQLHTFSLSAGGQLTRNNLHVSLNGEGAGAILNGLYCIKEQQHVDNHTAVDHRVPNCTSNQLYKGILNDSSRAVFNGKIYVRKDAQQTNSYQLNKNLLLGKDCRVDTKPQLEIFANDVKCTHGATIGQLSEEEIFYLQSRAIPKSSAIKLLARGFVDDILNTLENDAVISKLNKLLAPTFSALK